MAKVIEFLGLKTTTDDGDHHRADCPACNSKNALYITLSAGKYFCHAEKRGVTRSVWLLICGAAANVRRDCCYSGSCWANNPGPTEKCQQDRKSRTLSTSGSN